MKQSLPEFKNKSRAVRLLDGIVSNKILISVLRYIPETTKSWMKRQYWKFKISSGSGIVAAEELTRKYAEAILWLRNQETDAALGDYLEFGVFNGTSLACMHEVVRDLKAEQVRLFGFDSFEGMPLESKKEDGGWYPGQFKSELDETRYNLTRQGIDWKKTFLTKGWFKDTLTEDFKRQHNIRKASVIMIDCDIYSAAKESLNFCKSLIVDKAIIVFDDWNSGNLADHGLGEKKAFTEFLAENPQFVAEEFGEYNYRNKPNGKLFVVTNQLANSNN